MNTRADARRHRQRCADWRDATEKGRFETKLYLFMHHLDRNDADFTRSGKVDVHGPFCFDWGQIFMTR
jgi:hypothetical protein